MCSSLKYLLLLLLAEFMLLQRGNGHPVDDFTPIVRDETAAVAGLMKDFQTALFANEDGEETGELVSFDLMTELQHEILEDGDEGTADVEFDLEDLDLLKLQKNILTDDLLLGGGDWGLIDTGTIEETVVCMDLDDQCVSIAEHGFCLNSTFEDFAKENCQKSCGYCVEVINGGYGAFSDYSECSESCGGGFQERKRNCDNPAPANGGSDCVGPAVESRSCNDHACPINGGYGAFSDYSACSESCGGGFQERKRNCDNPAPANGGSDCVGPAVESRSCNDHACPINGGYGAFSDYSACSVSCGGGFQERKRNCDNPAPANGGSDCVGPAVESRSCNSQPCLGNCEDLKTVCPALRRMGFCPNPYFHGYTRKNCKRSCGLC